ncbi:helicase-exonuclease AddAB subunit AddA [Enterococcus timonensis]|uniref:helicase-exonuclease AddAB subunit AddA n=1 Tax=Enterococcus timonensis TaxID=1852364 RepID=UPI0008D9E782|nr:helicase-exonuclease AddAB subunit AddA [Enterococcus timonensis]
MNIPLKPADAQYTDSQWQAIYQTESNILVSASAGSGKTTVLVKRVIEKIRAGIGVDELLIVTFTESAAKEMKARIEVALKESLQNETGERRSYFLRQIAKLPAANISTLHAFCLNVIQRYYYLIGLDPKFRLLTDDTENILLKEEVWGNLREEFYQEEAFVSLSQNFNSDRNDDTLQEIIFKLANFALSLPDPVQWLHDLPNAYEEEKVRQNWQDLLAADAKSELGNIINEYDALIHQAEEPPLSKNLPKLQMERDFANIWVESLYVKSLEEQWKMLNEFSFDRWSALTKKEHQDDEVIKEAGNAIKDQRNLMKKRLQNLVSQLFPESPEKLTQMLPKAQALVATMSEKTRAFIEAYGQKKRQYNALDFNDLEHLALQILQTKDPVENQLTAQIFYQEKFQEVMVDEYQDINQLQEAILSSVAEVDNLFMVGDVKQSIYGFRLADPALFIEKYLAFQKNDPAVGQRILLQENFRSRPEVLQFTNLIFSQLMDEKVGQLDYDDDAALWQGNLQFQKEASFDPEILLFQKEKDEENRQEDAEELFDNDDNADAALEEADPFEDKTDGELTVVAQKIQELLAKPFQIFDKKMKKMRPVEYRDIVLLVPTKKNNLTILQTFKDYGMPVIMQDADNYFQAIEVKTMLALLKIIDNPYQDIPIVAVMHSAIFGFDEEELAEIRGKISDGDFYSAVLNYPKDSSPLAEKITDFCQQLENFRAAKKGLSLRQLIFYLYEETGFLDYVTGLAEGLQRKENLLALARRASQYEEMNYRGLFQFIRFIEKMQEKNKDLAEPAVLADENAVRVMTIHASKGLEFPVVFILDMTKKFNLRDLTEKTILDKKLGAGLSYLDEARVRHNTWVRLFIQQVKRGQLLSEEMRKLYVALTRAEQKIFLVGSYKSEEAMLNSWQQASLEANEKLSAPLRLKNSSMLDWVGYTLIRHPEMQAKLTVENPFTLKKLADYGHFSYTFYGADDLKPAVAVAPETLPNTEVSHITPEAVNILQAKYDDLAATQTASYQSVSEIKQIFADPDEKQMAPLAFHPTESSTTTQGRYVENELATPNFMATEKKITAASVGTAVHLLLQLVDLTVAPNVEIFKQLTDDLVEKGILTPEVVVRINFSKLVAFFATDFGQDLLKHATSLKREQPFSMLLEADTLFSEVKENNDLLIHGIIDGYFAIEEGLVLFDFKTDQIEKLSPINRAQTLKERYSGQLNLYQQAIEEATGKKVVAKVVVALDTNEAFAL